MALCAYAAVMAGCASISTDDINGPARVMASTEGAGVKSELYQDGDVYFVKWQSGDALLVADDSEDEDGMPIFKTYVLDDTFAGQTIAEFVEDDPSTAFIGGNAFALFPAASASVWPKEQSFSSESLSNNYCAMVASGEILSDKHGLSPMFFKHIGGALKISLTASGVSAAELNKVTVTSNDQYLAGYYILESEGEAADEYAVIEFDEEVADKYSHSIEVTFDKAPVLDAEEALDIYVAMVPGEYRNLKLTFECSNAAPLTIVSRETVSIARRQVTVANVAIELQDEAPAK